MRTIISRAADSDTTWSVPGTWVPVLRGGIQDAALICPVCGRYAMLDHEVDAEGVVTPSVECPYPGCSFHTHIVLEGWQAYWESKRPSQ